jgi:hypothetical protein
MNYKEDYQVGQVLLPEGDFIVAKYILISETEEDNEKEKLSIICLEKPYHYEIANFLRKVGRKFKVFGGGRLRMDNVNKEITLFDKSIDYGSCNEDMLRYVMEDFCKQINYKLKINEQ